MVGLSRLLERHTQTLGMEARGARPDFSQRRM
jgi:hypothetical protein